MQQGLFITRILVIDDDRIIRRSLSELLRVAGGYEVTTAEDGQEGLELAQADPPDLIICDVEMPHMDGYGVVEVLQQNAATATIPFIFLTGRGDRVSMRQGMTLGADDYIAKPFVAKELLAAVESRLAKRERIEGHYEQKLEKLRDNILLAVPHELRTPLSLIIGYGDIMAQRAETMPPDQIRSLAQTMTDAGRRLHDLVENYIIYAQIELLMSQPDRIIKMRQFREARPDDIVEELVQAKLTNSDRLVNLDLLARDVVLPISRNNLEKILGELIDNALKFSPPKTAVSLATAVANGTFTATVGNQGIGMTQEQINNIGAYMQFERKLQEQQGSGMGLVIAKRLTELYGGRAFYPEREGRNNSGNDSLASVARQILSGCCFGNGRF